MNASHSELPPPSDTSMSDASAASVAATEQPVSTADSASEAAAAEAAPTSRNGKEEVGDESAAGAAAADTSVAGTEKPVWLNFQPTPIRDDITPEIIEHILALRHTNRFFRQKSEPDINMLTKQLVALVLNGREDEAKALIEACPYLLERRATVTDPVGRVYKDVTAYEAALYAGDTQMCEMMAPFFKTKMDNEQKWIDEQIMLGKAGFKPGMRARDIRLEQCHKVFPDGDIQGVVNAQRTYNFSDILDAIDEATAEDVERQLQHKVVTDTELGQAINAFRETFVMLSKQEQHANLKHLLEAFRVYAENKSIAEWERTEDYGKMGVFWSQVIGFVQLYLPECDKQVFHQGLNNVVESDERRAREVNFKYDRGHSLHLLEGLSGCGFNFGADKCGMTNIPPNLLGCRVAWGAYVKQKHQTWNRAFAPKIINLTFCSKTVYPMLLQVAWPPRRL